MVRTLGLIELGRDGSVVEGVLRGRGGGGGGGDRGGSRGGRLLEERARDSRVEGHAEVN